MEIVPLNKRTLTEDCLGTLTVAVIGAILYTSLCGGSADFEATNDGRVANFGQLDAMQTETHSNQTVIASKRTKESQEAQCWRKQPLHHISGNRNECANRYEGWDGGIRLARGED